MIWRAWIFGMGLPAGALAALALDLRSSGAALGVVAGFGALGVLAASLLTRTAPPDAGPRGPRLAAASSVGALGLPALAATLLGLTPGPAVWLGVVCGVFALALWRAARRRAPAAGPLAWALRGVVVLATGSVAVAAVAGVWAALGSEVPVWDERQALAAYEQDARILTQPLPRCAPRVARSEVLLRRGAHPRLALEGDPLWFDAVSDDGRRQVYRLALRSRELLCWTCGEPGNNRRPAPGGDGRAVVFDTDRHVGWRTPANTEVHLVRARGSEPPGSSRRLTFSPDRDDHALLAPGSRAVVWSQSRRGGTSVVSAGLRSGHGALLLGRAGVLVSGGADWVAPLAWSSDARHLVVARGNPLGRLEAIDIDPASGARTRLGLVAGASAAAFSADAGWRVVSTAERARGAARLPAALGFLVAPLAASRGGEPVGLEGSGVRSGASTEEGAAVDLGALAQWGAPTGVALAPDGRSLVLGQRRATDAGVEERLVRVELECEQDADDA